MNRFISDKLLNGKLKQACGISHKYLRDMLSIVKSVANYCEETYGIPNKIRHTKSINVEKPTITVLEKDDKTTLSKALCKDTKHSKLGILLALYTGLRIGEVCGLKWEDYNETDCTIAIKRTVQRISDGKGSTELLVGSPKTKASQRIIPFPCVFMICVTLMSSYN